MTKDPPEGKTAAKDVGPGGGFMECSQSLESLIAHSTARDAAAMSIRVYSVDRWLHVEARP